jgi:hypothetical protein
MRVRAFGIVCLISGVLAVPVPEEAQGSQQQVQQVQPHHEPPADDGSAGVVPPGFPDPQFPEWPGFPEDGDEGFEFDPAMMAAGHGQVHGGHSILSGNVDVEAFEEMVSQVQSQVQAIGTPVFFQSLPLSPSPSPNSLSPTPQPSPPTNPQPEQMLTTTTTDPNALMEALVTPMTEIDATLAKGVSRINLGGLVGGLGGLVGGAKKKAPLSLLGDLLRTVSNLLENLLTKGPIGELLNGLLGGILGGVGGTVGGVLGGAVGGGAGGAGAQVPELVDSILGQIGTLLPGGAGAVVGGLLP